MFAQDMTKEQIANEKVALQKALLHYESIHGRPVCNVLSSGGGGNSLALGRDLLCSASCRGVCSCLLPSLFE